MTATPGPCPRPATRPLHMRPRAIALVVLGGGVGTTLRALLVLVAPPRAADATVLAINVIGAFALGLLLERLLVAGPDSGRHRDARLLLGTGVLGGFTTYSTLALDTVHLVQGGRVGMAIAYALATVLLGAGASLAGVRVGARRRVAP